MQKTTSKKKKKHPDCRDGQSGCFYCEVGREGIKPPSCLKAFP